jgi:hypothetical protein
VANRTRQPTDWQPDIDQSVGEYNEWYLAHAPDLWAEARGRAVLAAAEAMDLTDAFRSFTPDLLRQLPRLVTVGRIAVAPPWARDRLVYFAEVSKNLVTKMELENIIPQRARDVNDQLERIAEVVNTALDPGLFVWLEQGRGPTALERDKALLVIGERLTRNFYDPLLRNAQERRQKALMGTWLRARGFEESPVAAFSLQPGQFGMGRNVVAVREDGQPQNLPTDCVIRPLDTDLPLVCLEMKSAGDFTNVNKRRKEESDKHDAYARAHGDKVLMLLQLFGYFDRTYLGFEASAGIDWAWDHRLEDLEEYLGF